MDTEYAEIDKIVDIEGRTIELPFPIKVMKGLDTTQTLLSIIISLSKGMLEVKK